MSKQSTNKKHIYKQIIQQQKEEIENLKKINQDYALALNFLSQNSDVDKTDLIKVIDEFKELTKQARQNLREVEELKKQLINEKAKHQMRLEEALRNIIG